jgi:Ca2+-binding EF-hand superfamily protein
VSIKPNTDDSSLHDAFRRYDQNGDGEISFDEFVALLEDLGDGLSDAERRLAFDATDHDDNGSIDFKSSRLGGTTPERANLKMRFDPI